MPIFKKDGRNFLFVHVPKTGGTTIENVFRDSGYQVLYLDGKMGREAVNHVRRCTPQHMHAEMLQTNFRLERFDATFMMVRDPLNRFKSEYIWRNRKGLKGVDAESVNSWGAKAFRKYRTDNFLFDNHLRPQVDFYVPGSNVYYFETGMQFVVDDLNRRFGLDVGPNIPRLKDGQKETGFSSKDVVVSPKMETAVKEFYEADYLRFGYPL
ncbi:sulfotransferase family 2 domain-containing protein [Arthrobacter castelli]|uniref:sulfotransferase family 2 domain-containing protein n=1 Tax=Arthrobacter castelli TaxID=271431 RepID=UPI0003F85581|nr:sulfotransferase family 2 domain-containing protein [Arthrobacter castelli]